MDVRDLAEELLGIVPAAIRPSASPTVFFAELDDHTVVLKFPAAGRSVLAEAWAYQAAAAQGVTVPLVLATRSDPEMIAVEFLPGSSLWSRERRDKDNSFVWRRAGEELRALHEIRIDGFGPLAPDGAGVQGRSGAWCPFVRFARDEGIRRLVDAGVLEARIGRRLEQRYDDASPDLHAWSDGRLLHSDLEGGHLLVENDHYRGMIDFDQAQAGDPRWDLARVPLWDGDPALDALLDGYGRDTICREDRELLLPLYLLAFVINFAVQLTARGDLDGARGHLAQTRYERLARG